MLWDTTKFGGKEEEETENYVCSMPGGIREKIYSPSRIGQSSMVSNAAERASSKKTNNRALGWEF